MQTFSLCLGGFGIVGTLTLLSLTGVVMWYYRDSRAQSFRWHWRNIRLKQLSAIACMFFTAMAASYGILQEAWGFIYLIAAFKTATWWLRFVMSRRV
jgi:hypothetical protein